MFTEQLDGWIARKWNSRSVLGSILDPAADKALMTTLVVTLAWSGQLPRKLAIAMTSLMRFTDQDTSLAGEPDLWSRLGIVHLGLLFPVHLFITARE